MRVNVDLPATMIDDLDKEARETGTSRSDLVKRFLSGVIYDDECENDSDGDSDSDGDGDDS